MMTSETEYILIKFLSSSANATELDYLEGWIQQPENKSIFDDFIKTHYAITIGMNDLDKIEIRNRLMNEIRKDKKQFKTRKLSKVLKYAAIAIFFIGTGYFLSEIKSIGKDITVMPSHDDIVLEQEGGIKRIIKEGGAIHLTDVQGNSVGHQNGESLVYQKPNTLVLPTKNKLSVPFGKRFNLTLSDGTVVHLNSGSTIRYPTYFISENKREVFLEGEAYFDVAHDENLSFQVNTNEIDVIVHGTKFNVSTYPEDVGASVVLISGSVGLSAKEADGASILIEPGFRGTFDGTGKTFATKKVDTSLYTSWLQGQLVFRNTPFKNILRKLERQYNVVIINNNQILGDETFNATIETDRESIEQVFKYFNRIHDIDYEVLNNKIIIN
ncbi:hypothetical protein LCGC14_0719610 [marine sediment metagenome]|uniref:FecR family protein n=2 Tax=root TaxID=1 RepID=A0A831QMT3_9FLAO|nr:FecR family protein [Pricia sp.]HEA19522.1 FecR family protein [Pricia antarctica]